MSTELDLQKLEGEVRRLEQSLEAARAASRAAQRIAILIGTAMATLVGGFLLINYFNFRAEFTPEKVKASIAQELRDVSPAALREFGQLGQELLPVYTEELKRQFQAAWPSIKDKVDNEVTLLAEHATTRIDRRMTDAEGRVIDTSQALMQKHYPELADPKVQETVTRRVHEVCDGSLQKALDGFNALFARDMRRVQHALLQFEFPPSSVPTVELQKKFLHLWLQLLDQEIMQL
jgi:hypothetical protein